MALAVAFGMTPGSVGFVEDAIHVVEVGHVADVHATGGHGADHDQGWGGDTDHGVPSHDDRGPSDEHGCSGVFHSCSCHIAPVFVQGHGAWRLDAPLALDVGGSWNAIPRHASSVSAAVDRPPIA